MENTIITDQQSLYAAVQYYGLLKDLELIENSIHDNEPLAIEKGNVFVNFWNKHVVNEKRRIKMNKLSVQKSEILDRICQFKNKHDGLNIDYSCGESRELLARAVEKNYYGENARLGKVLFALRFCMDGEVTFVNKDGVNASVSELLFNDRGVIDTLFRDLKENYIQLYKAPFVTAQKYILAGLGISSLITVALPPLFIAGSAITAFAMPAILNSGFGAVIAGGYAATELLAISSTMFLGGALVGTEIAKQLKLKDVRNDLRKASPEDIGLLLAIKATLIQYAKKVLDGEKMKEVLDDCLKQLNDLRSDAEYVLIVERLDAENTKKKIDLCGRFTNRLVSIVGF